MQIFFFFCAPSIRTFEFYSYRLCGGIQYNMFYNVWVLYRLSYIYIIYVNSSIVLLWVCGKNIKIMTRPVFFSKLNYISSAILHDSSATTLFLLFAIDFYKFIIKYDLRVVGTTYVHMCILYSKITLI